MEILTAKNKFEHPVCIALGFFDCVHSGHRVLLQKAIDRAGLSQSKSCAVTFVNNPYINLSKATDKLIFTYAERKEIFSDIGLDVLLPIVFDSEMREMDGRKFLDWLCGKVNLSGIVCGYDFRFGKDAAGNCDDISDFCAKNNIMCDIIQPVMIDNVRISSTLVRNFLIHGDIESAVRLMGHTYFINGNVCHGRGVGGSCGFPTANLRYDTDKLLPAAGVYATITHADGHRYKSVTNVGAKPTFAESSIDVETMLIGFNGNLYGKEIKVEFVRRLRDIRKFSSAAELGEQIFKDAEWR